MAQIIINNGVSYSGKNISINNQRIIIDGVEINDESKVINIEIKGDVNSVNVTHCNSFKITGNTGNVQSSSGDITIEGGANDVTSSSGDIEINSSVSGNVKSSSGDIQIKGTVGGDVSSKSGDVSYRK